MSLFFGSTNSYLSSSPNIAPNSTVDRYKLWARARTGVDPGLRPSLDLNFAANKSLVDDVSGLNLVSFARGSTGTYVGADGLLKSATTNEPRFDHDPVTKECLGLLIEEQRTNYLFAYASPSYNTGSLAQYVSVTDDPVFGAESAVHGWYFVNGFIGASKELGWSNPGSISTTGNGIVYTWSVWIKASQNCTFYGNILDERRSSVNFTVNATTSWQKFSFSTPSNVNDDGSGTVYFRILRDTALQNIPAGTTIYFARSQLEIGSFPTSYIPTSGSTATRSADIMQITGSNFSRWYNQNEGTAFVQTRNINSGDYSQAPFIGFDNSGGIWNNVQEWGVRYRDSPNTFETAVWDSSGSSGGMINSGDRRLSAKIAMGLNTTSSALSVNGNIQQVSRTAGTMPSINSLLFRIGSDPKQSTQFSRFTYWNRRLPNSNLQSMTQ